MSLRSLGSLLTRRFSPRGIPRAQAQANTLGPAVGRQARSFHSLRDLAVGDGAYGGVATAALAGLFGILYFMKGSDKSAGEAIGEKARKEATEEEARKQGGMLESAVKEDNDSDFSLEKYLVEMKELAAAQKAARYEREVSAKKAVKAVTNSEAVKEEDMKEEAAMKARFEEWMKEYGRRYKNEEEKARRYELFKAFAKMVDKATAQSGDAVFVTNHTADWTEEECQCLYDNDDDWDDYLDHIQSLIDKKNAKAKKAIKE
ncbi:hypothetical protein BAE44_0017943 [Dichanthelium oligosanthes]|uniref:Cathepsin propeptide inhibitor domain-containing protein n=1 Tax=Dichanthelium oligosanthes TaxID=888268 RepID=A0A1E5V7E9_9POAL|nr:hypothetical protein BAE44_0017943 [Dichanthelium oligosanthes]